ncbi:hypothetical protein Y032_0557g3388 [Ancylostoma ceylanicum]|uniref:Uncharacterized protein n=1 Tax=Ancylostoma ceylanicum TaxID=53326 RepID=A0A016WQ91_9BILA|nr:hypothetical protein Y032_0557g3388 [Ancylostoma ceylanicum]
MCNFSSEIGKDHSLQGPYMFSQCQLSSTIEGTRTNLARFIHSAIRAADLCHPADLCIFLSSTVTNQKLQMSQPEGYLVRLATDDGSSPTPKYCAKHIFVSSLTSPRGRDVT